MLHRDYSNSVPLRVHIALHRYPAPLMSLQGLRVADRPFRINVGHQCLAVVAYLPCDGQRFGGGSCCIVCLRCTRLLLSESRTRYQQHHRECTHDRSLHRTPLAGHARYEASYGETGSAPKFKILMEGMQKAWVAGRFPILPGARLRLIFYPVFYPRHCAPARNWTQCFGRHEQIRVHRRLGSRCCTCGVGRGGCRGPPR
ncbi:hypothetical protein SBA1_540010 [Candidatus Sulfotelmatobacter kueseliae]|uniref:Uncharacterized protein n=1 Tax=Candidatus Sulfotelmatobacter kueseliae TaxID=2042962 RepID=A0A2U3KY58_9BACT|nr:hypothetical protein SBA1_540010 [Candidatus Sulfotelmatobacter kueseliae]